MQDAPKPECVRFANFTFDIAGYTLTDDQGRDLRLRRSEFALLLAFVRAPGRVLSRDQLLNAVANRLSGPFDRSIDMLISRLRRKIEADPASPRLILTLPGLGYKFAARPRGARPGELDPAEANVQPRSAERRQLTVLACGLTGPGGSPARLDPEDLHALIEPFEACALQVIARFGGLAASAPRDRVMAYFGYPLTGEDDAERAIRAGMAITQELSRLDDRLRARVAISTGVAILGSRPNQRTPVFPALGEPTELAADLLSLAPPGAVIVSGSCQQLAGGMFEYDPVALPTGSFGHSTRAFRVLGERPVEGRFEALRQSGLTQFVGREDHLKLLRRRWRQARSGSGQVVLVSGEAGMGKSRLIHELRRGFPDDACTVLTFSCAPHRQDSAYFPFTEYLKRAAEFTRMDDDRGRLRKLEALLQSTSAAREDVALLADLLSLQVADLGVTLPLHRRRERTIGAVIEHVAVRSLGGPVLMIFEDVHWADPTSREVLERLVVRIINLPVLLIITLRPEFTLPWSSRTNVTTIVLNTLDPHEALKLADELAHGTLPEPICRQIIERADGVPLFVEELTRALLENGPATDFAVPTSLYSSLMARLDSMTDAKLVAQVGAVVGREFPYELIAAVPELSEPLLRHGLRELVDSGLVFCRGEASDAVYSFKHSLLRDAAYETLLRTRRLALHGAIATELMKRNDAGGEVSPELLGYHCEQAGMARNAVRYYLKAGERLAAKSAMAEARALLTRGLKLMAHIPLEIEAQLWRTEIMLALGNVEMAVHGYGSPEHGAAFKEAVALCRVLHGDPQDAGRLLARALHGYWIYQIHTGQVMTSQPIAAELRDVGRTHDNPEVRRFAATSYAVSCFLTGKLKEGAEVLDLELAEEPREGQSQSALIGFGVDACSASYAVLSRIRACQGFAGEARQRTLIAIERARHLRHLPTIATCLIQACDVGWILRDPCFFKDWTAELMELSEEQGFEYWRARCKAYLGWLAAAAGQLIEGQKLLTDALAELGGIGVVLYGPHIRSMLADVYAGLDEHDQALELLDEALDVCSRTGEVWAEPELHRQKGELLRSKPEVAKACFELSVEIARGQSAELFQLRAAASLARFAKAG